jgi:nitrogen PTS system EIIA component
VDIADLIPPDRVIVGLQVSSKSHLLAELSRRAAAATGLPQKQVADALEARESLGSTGVGGGIAIPHAQLAGLGAFYGLFVRLGRPLDYDAIDGRPVDLVFLLLIPPGTKEHLQALAAIARRLRDAHIAAALRAATTAPQAHAALTRAP